MRKTRLVSALLLATAALMGARPAAGQQLFKTSRAQVDLSTYTNIFDCLSAVGRVLDELDAKEYYTTWVWKDTLPPDLDEDKRHYPPIVGETARACLKATTEDAQKVPIKTSWHVLANLYLHAGMEDSARAVVERRLAAVPQDSTEVLRQLFTDILFLFNGQGLWFPRISPTRLEIADDIVLDNVGRLPTLDARLQVYMQMLVTGGEDFSRDNERGARARRLLARMKTQLDSITEADAQGLANRGLVYDDMRMTPEKARERLQGMSSFFLGRVARLDDLRVSTPAYSEATRKVFSQATGQPPEAYPWPLGQKAPQLEGDVWLGCEQDPCEAYPRPGRISIVAFHVPEAALRTTTRERVVPNLLRPLFHEGACAERAISLRHLQERFPEIDIIIVTRTLGRYHYAKEGVTPEREAEFLLECFKSHGLNRVVISMTKTPGWRLPEPDGRWVMQPFANWTNYSFGGIWTDPDREQHGSDLIVDQEGYVLNAFVRRVYRNSEEAFAEIIKVLLEREKAKT